MFEIFIAVADWWLTAIFLILLLGPIGSFFLGPRKFRQQEIVDGLSTSALQLYLKTFYQDQATDPRAKFKKLYIRRFGWRRHFGALVDCSTASASPPWPARTRGVVHELITRWRFRDVSPGDLWTASWRLVLAVPLALAVGALFAKEVAVPIAFFLGSFPSRSVTTIARRFGRRTMNLGADSDETLESELQKLQGVDTRIAERLADEGITTIVQLAYFDPIDLTMRCASFSFSFIVDINSQALAHIYVGDKLAAASVLARSARDRQHDQTSGQRQRCRKEDGPRGDHLGRQGVRHRRDLHGAHPARDRRGSVHQVPDRRLGNRMTAIPG